MVKDTKAYIRPAGTEETMVNIFTSNLRPPKRGETLINTEQWFLVLSVNTDGGR